MSVPAGGRESVSHRLPDFPWDKLTGFRQRAAEHPDGLVDLSVGTPVDPTPQVAQQALTDAADAAGYPTTLGIPELRSAAAHWLARNHGVTGVAPEDVLPAVGTKELIAALPLHLGVGAGDLVVYPQLAYPTYEVSAALVGAEAVASDSLTALGPRTPRLLWLNSPSNPTGRVLPVEHLAKVVEWCRERGTLLLSDECYIECSWTGTKPVSVLHPSVSGDSNEGILAVHSLSKRSNLAGYRAGFVTGDPAVVAELLEVRKNLGLMMPAPIQHAMAATLADDAHAAEQHARYAARRAKLLAALTGAGFAVDHSEASLYLWTTAGQDCWTTVAELAELGILVAPGAFYGAAGRDHVRIAFTATDDRIDAAVARLTAG